MVDKGESNDEDVVTATPPKETREKRGRLLKNKFVASESDNDAEMDNLEPSCE